MAVAVTVIAVPAAVLLDRDKPADEAGAALPIGTPAPVLDTIDRDDVIGTVPSDYLNGTAAPEVREPAVVAMPIVPESIKGTASYDSDIDSLKHCRAKGVPFNATLTVVNLDNSQSVQCIASSVGFDPESDVVLHTQAFVKIADLTDAPVPVRITWSIE